MSTISASILHATGALRFDRVGADTPIDIPANGILQVAANAGSSITIGGGGATELLGIDYVDAKGDATVIDDSSTDMKVFRAAPGVEITVRHNRTTDLSAGAIPAAQRILTSSGRDIMLDGVNTQAFFAYVPSLTSFRWYFADRLGPKFASTSASVTSGVAFTVWSATLAEGDVIGGRLEVTGGYESAGTTARSRAWIDFTGSRDVGGSAAVTTNDSANTGGVTITCVASGNDVLIQLNYAVTDTVFYAYRVTHDRLAIPQP